jgi:hypothetical protein
MAAFAKQVASWNRQYDERVEVEDVTQQAVLECLEASGGAPFPLSDLTSRARTIWERFRMEDRRAVKRHVPIADDLDDIAEDDHETVVLVDYRSPEAILMERDEPRSRDNIVYLERTERRKQSNRATQARRREKSKR